MDMEADPPPRSIGGSMSPLLSRTPKTDANINHHLERKRESPPAAPAVVAVIVGDTVVTELGNSESGPSCCPHTTGEDQEGEESTTATSSICAIAFAGELGSQERSSADSLYADAVSTADTDA